MTLRLSRFSIVVKNKKLIVNNDKLKFLFTETFETKKH